jgi:hypothetical protein
VERAASLERGAVDQANRYGMSADLVPGPVELTLVRCGRDWELRAGSRVVTIRHSVGMVYLSELVKHPGREVRASDLATRYEATPSDGRQEVLDGTARSAYRRRVGELREEIDDAEALADIGRAARAKAELDQLLDELRRLTGLHGRARVFDDADERARTSVQKAIRRAIAAVSEVDPAMGQLLQASIVTGTRCAYLPRVTPA